MALVPWKPFDDFDRFFGNEDDWFLPVVRSGQRPSGRGQGFSPAMDVYEEGDNVIAEMTLPNIDPEKVDVSVEDHILRVSGHTEEATEENEQDRGYWKKEIRKGSFERMVRLPASVKEDAVEATYKKGVLKVVMPKEEEKEKGTKVKVKSEE